MVDRTESSIPRSPLFEELANAVLTPAWARALYQQWSSSTSPMLRCAAVGLIARASAVDATDPGLAAERRAAEWGEGIEASIVDEVLASALEETETLEAELVTLDTLTDEDDPGASTELADRTAVAARRWDTLECIRLPLGRRVAPLGRTLDRLAEEYLGLGEVLGELVDLGDDARLCSAAAWDSGVWWSTMIYGPATDALDPLAEKPAAVLGVIESTPPILAGRRPVPAARATTAAARMSWLCPASGATARGFAGTSEPEKDGRFSVGIADARGARPGQVRIDLLLNATDRSLANARGVLRFVVDGGVRREIEFRLQGLRFDGCFEIEPLEVAADRVQIVVELFT